MTSKIRRRKDTGTSGRITPLDTSTFTDFPSSWTDMTLSTLEDSAALQSAQLDCSAASSAMSTGGCVAAAGTWPAAATKGAFGGPTPAALELLVAGSAGRDSVSATTLDGPAMWRISVENSALADNCCRWRSERGSETLDKAPTRGL
jgi:hypothetical protein